MAIIKKELNTEEMKKLSEEDLKQVDGGAIRIVDTVSFNADTGDISIGSLYKVFDDNWKLIATCLTMEDAMDFCKEFSCSTEIYDERKYAEPVETTD